MIAYDFLVCAFVGANKISAKNKRNGRCVDVGGSPSGGGRPVLAPESEM